MQSPQTTFAGGINIFHAYPSEKLGKRPTVVRPTRKIATKKIHHQVRSDFAKYLTFYGPCIPRKIAYSLGCEISHAGQVCRLMAVDGILTRKKVRSAISGLMIWEYAIKPGMTVETAPTMRSLAIDYLRDHPMATARDITDSIGQELSYTASLMRQLEYAGTAVSVMRPAVGRKQNIKHYTLTETA